MKPDKLTLDLFIPYQSHLLELHLSEGLNNAIYKVRRVEHIIYIEREQHYAISLRRSVQVRHPLKHYKTSSLIPLPTKTSDIYMTPSTSVKIINKKLWTEEEDGKLLRLLDGLGSKAKW
jgi:hypothetical protein